MQSLAQQQQQGRQQPTDRHHRDHRRRATHRRILRQRCMIRLLGLPVKSLGLSSAMGRWLLPVWYRPWTGLRPRRVRRRRRRRRGEKRHRRRLLLRLAQQRSKGELSSKRNWQQTTWALSAIVGRSTAAEVDAHTTHPTVTTTTTWPCPRLPPPLTRFSIIAHAPHALISVVATSSSTTAAAAVMMISTTPRAPPRQVAQQEGGRAGCAAQQSLAVLLRGGLPLRLLLLDMMTARARVCCCALLSDEFVPLDPRICSFSRTMSQSAMPRFTPTHNSVALLSMIE